MNPRERTLLLLVVVAGAVLIGHRAYQAMIVQPMVDLDAQIDQAEQTVAGYERDLGYQRPMRDYEEKLKAGSLPYDEMLARNQYQTYLNAKLDACRLSPPSVNVKRGPKISDDCRAVGASVKAQGTLDQIAAFLHGLQTDPLLQQVDRLSIKAVGEKPGERFEMNVGLTALAMRGVGPREPLLRPGADVPGPKPAHETLDAYGPIAQVNIFKPYVPPPPPPPKRTTGRPTPPKPTPRRPAPPPPPKGGDLQLTAICLDTQLTPSEYVLLINPRDTNTEAKEVFLGQTIPELDGKLVAIMRDQEQIVAEIDGKYYVFENGDAMNKRQTIRPGEFPLPEQDEPEQGAPSTQARDLTAEGGENS